LIFDADVELLVVEEDFLLVSKGIDGRPGVVELIE
jgi:hypothetical protein